jgi:hypothetical protein
MRIASGARIVATALFSSILASSANADTITFSSWVLQFEGISLSKATILSSADSTTVNTSVAYIERIDLTAPGIGFTTTPPSGPLETTSQTTSQFLESSGAQVAINANFFSNVAATPGPEDLIGLAVSNGVVVSPQAFGSNDAAASLLLSQTNQATIFPATTTAVNLSNVFNSVSGNQIVTNGVNTSSITPTGAPHDPFGLDPRTGAGVSQNGQYLYLIAVDGRQPSYSIGITTSTEATLMLDLGIYNGLNLDGGGSTALVESNGTGGARLIDFPSGTDGAVERYDGNNLGVFADPIPTPEPSLMLGVAAGLIGLLTFVELRTRRARSEKM